MKPRIAIPQPHSQKQDYNERTLPYYTHAIEASGGEPVIVPLSASPEEVARIVTECQGVLLPGSSADVDPQKYGEERIPETNDADPLRDNADELLLQDAYNMRKPVFGICYGLQSLNVWRTGTLVQDIKCSAELNHAIGSKVAEAHTVTVEPTSRFAKILGEQFPSRIPVNSSHHQSAQTVGDGLRVVAQSEDDVVEAVEGTNPEHFVLAVQWHPERGFDTDAASQKLFKSFVEEARKYKPKPMAGG